LVYSWSLGSRAPGPASAEERVRRRAQAARRHAEASRSSGQSRWTSPAKDCSMPVDLVKQHACVDGSGHPGSRGSSATTGTPSTSASQKPGEPDPARTSVSSTRPRSMTVSVAMPSEPRARVWLLGAEQDSGGELEGCREVGDRRAGAGDGPHVLGTDGDDGRESLASSERGDDDGDRGRALPAHRPGDLDGGGTAGFPAVVLIGRSRGRRWPAAR
jgi:hypothetical protein